MEAEPLNSMVMFFIFRYNDIDSDEDEESLVRRWNVETSSFDPAPVDLNLMQGSRIYTGQNPSRWHKAVNRAAYKLCRKNPKLMLDRGLLYALVS